MSYVRYAVLFRQSTTSEREAGLAWYDQARASSTAIADKYGIPPLTMMAIYNRRVTIARHPFKERTDHMLNAYMGRVVFGASRPYYPGTPGLKRKATLALRKAARTVGESVRDTQATIWLVWRRKLQEGTI